MDFGNILYEWYSNSLPNQILKTGREIAFGHGKGSGVMAPIPTDLYGACEYTASLKGQLGFQTKIGRVQSTTIGLM